MKKAHVLKNKNLVVSPDFCFLRFKFTGLIYVNENKLKFLKNKNISYSKRF